MNIYILVNLVAGGGRQSSESLCPAHAFLPRRSRGRPSFVPASLFHRACSLSLSPREGGFLERRRKSDGRFARPGRGGNDRWRERERGYRPAAPAVEVVQALLVACSRTYTLDRTFDLGSRGIADDLGSYVYVERGG